MAFPCPSLWPERLLQRIAPAWATGNFVEQSASREFPLPFRGEDVRPWLTVAHFHATTSNRSRRDREPYGRTGEGDFLLRNRRPPHPPFGHLLPKGRRDAAARIENPATWPPGRTRTM